MKLSTQVKLIDYCIVVFWMFLEQWDFPRNQVWSKESQKMERIENVTRQEIFHSRASSKNQTVDCKFRGKRVAKTKKDLNRISNDLNTIK